MTTFLRWQRQMHSSSRSVPDRRSLVCFLCVIWCCPSQPLACPSNALPAVLRCRNATAAGCIRSELPRHPSLGIVDCATAVGPVRYTSPRSLLTLFASKRDRIFIDHSPSSSRPPPPPPPSPAPVFDFAAVCPCVNLMSDTASLGFSEVVAVASAIDASTEKVTLLYSSRVSIATAFIAASVI